MKEVLGTESPRPGGDVHKLNTEKIVKTLQGGIRVYLLVVTNARLI